MYPGQTITIPGVVVGQDFGAVAGLVFAQFVKTAASDSIAVKLEQGTTGIGHCLCTNLSYTLFALEEVANTTLAFNVSRQFQSSSQPSATSPPYSTSPFPAVLFTNSIQSLLRLTSFQMQKHSVCVAITEPILFHSEMSPRVKPSL